MAKNHSTHYKESVASSSGEAPVYLLEITHDQLLTPIRVVADTHNLYWNFRLSLPGINNNYASTPYVAGTHDVTGDFEVVFWFAATDWTPAASNRIFLQDSGSTRRWFIELATSGRIGLNARPAAGAMFGITGFPVPTVQAATGVQDGQGLWFKINRTTSTGIVRVFWSTDGFVWTQLGADVAGGAAGTPIATDGVDMLWVGHSSGALSAIGGVKYAELRKGINGSVAARFDVIDTDPGVTSFRSRTGETWTINQSGGTPAVLVAGTTFVACSFRITWPEDVASVMPRVPVAIDNVGRELTQWLEASNGGKGAQFRCMEVMRDTPDVIEQEYSMTLLRAGQNMIEVSGDLGYENVLDLPGLAATYTPETAPGLF